LGEIWQTIPEKEKNVSAVVQCVNIDGVSSILSQTENELTFLEMA
jgi:hypothetical protein